MSTTSTFTRGQVTVRDPKWKHDRVTILPASVSTDLARATRSRGRTASKHNALFQNRAMTTRPF